jgi:ribosome-associated protein
MTSKILAKKIAQASLTKKALEVLAIDLRKVTSMTDYFVICSADSDTQVRAIADAVKHELVEEGEHPVRREGYAEGRWILLDYVDVVVHVFHKELRSFYNLEKLWSDGKIEHFQDEPVKSTSQPTGVQKKKAPRKTTSKKK